MRQREFFKPVSGAAIHWPRVARAQEAAMLAVNGVRFAALIRAMVTTSLLLIFTIGLTPAAAGSLEDAATAYYSGDYATALRLVRPLADQGNPEAGGLLGEMYELGRGVPEDLEHAIKLYTDAAYAGSLRAQHNLGFLSFSVSDYGNAVRWIRQAADHGYAPAQNLLASFYDIGAGVPRNSVDAAKWYRRAADQGYPPAQRTLGYRYESGIGVPQDYVLAYMWFNLAASRFPTLRTMHSKVRLQSEIETAHERDKIASKLSPAQIAEAQKLAREWKPRF